MDISLENYSEIKQAIRKLGYQVGRYAIICTQKVDDYMYIAYLKPNEFAKKIKIGRYDLKRHTFTD